MGVKLEQPQNWYVFLSARCFSLSPFGPRWQVPSCLFIWTLPACPRVRSCGNATCVCPSRSVRASVPLFMHWSVSCQLPCLRAPRPLTSSPLPRSFSRLRHCRHLSRASPLSPSFCSSPGLHLHPVVTWMRKLDGAVVCHGVMNISENAPERLCLLARFMSSPGWVFISANKVCALHLRKGCTLTFG